MTSAPSTNAFLYFPNSPPNLSIVMFSSGMLRTLHALYSSSFLWRPFCRKFPEDMQSKKMLERGPDLAPDVMLRMVGPKNIVSSSGCDVT